VHHLADAPGYGPKQLVKVQVGYDLIRQFENELKPALSLFGKMKIGCGVDGERKLIGYETKKADVILAVGVRERTADFENAQPAISARQRQRAGGCDTKLSENRSVPGKLSIFAVIGFEQPVGRDQGLLMFVNPADRRVSRSRVRELYRLPLPVRIKEMPPDGVGAVLKGYELEVVEGDDSMKLLYKHVCRVITVSATR
jgi:hypothetical protein